MHQVDFTAAQHIVKPGFFVKIVFNQEYSTGAGMFRA
jgi:hypothetical protein